LAGQVIFETGVHPQLFPLLGERIKGEGGCKIHSLSGRFAFPADTGMHTEQFKIVNVENNEELASVGS
jgi:hypothetical protein